MTDILADERFDGWPGLVSHVAWAFHTERKDTRAIARELMLPESTVAAALAEVREQRRLIRLCADYG